MEIPCNSNLKFASFDITNRYSNVPINELLKILNVLCERHEMFEGIKQEIMKISQILIQQNYFRFQGTVYIQK
jgi:hypothetical protein